MSTVHPDLDDRIQAALTGVETPVGMGGVASGRVRLALERMYRHLVENGDAGASELQTVGHNDKVASFTSRGELWAWTEQVLPFLPGVSADGGGVYSFDRDRAARDPPRPPAPDALTHPPDEQVTSALEALTFPGDRENPTRHRQAIRDAWDTLREQRTATRDDLREAFTPMVYDKPEEGYFNHRQTWWLAVGRPALATFPGVARPVIPGEAWVYVGDSER